MVRAPLRISFFGGGTDYPAWYLKNGGAVISAAIDRYCYVTLKKLPPFFNHRHRIVYSKIEEVESLEDVQHPAVRAILTHYGNGADSYEMHHFSDLPARTGLGSSSAFSAALLSALEAINGRNIDKESLLRETLWAEQKLMGESVGSQDQTASVYGGLNHIRFGTDGRINVQPIHMSVQAQTKLLAACMLFYTGTSRLAETIAAKKTQNVSVRQRQLSAIHESVGSALELLTDEEVQVDGLGALMHQMWQMKKELADGVSNASLDQIYDRAIDAGALGGKLLGAGGGGFFLFIVPESKQSNVRKALSDLLLVDFGIDADGVQRLAGRLKPTN